MGGTSEVWKQIHTRCATIDGLNDCRTYGCHTKPYGAWYGMSDNRLDSNCVGKELFETL